LLVCGASLQNHFQLLKKNITLLKAENINFSAGDRKSKILQLRSLQIESGTCIYIPGQNGAGKSSLLAVLGGFLAPNTGEIFWKGKKLKPLKDRLMPGFEGIELVKQDPDLNSFLTVNEQLEKAARQFNDKESKTAIQKTVSICHLKSLLMQKTGSLSGGEKRRLSIGIAIMKGCELLLLDEPFADLDAENKLLFMSLLLNIRKENNIAICIVSHNGEDALWLADEIWTLNRGRILEKVKRENGSFSPTRMQTAVLLGWKNVFRPSAFPQIKGEAHRDWIRIPAEKINTQSRGALLGEGVLLSQFYKDSFLHRIWRIDSIILESIDNEAIDPAQKNQKLFLEE